MRDKITQLDYGWTLIDDGRFEQIQTHSYTIRPPKWYMRFAVSDEDPVPLAQRVTRAGEDLVQHIIRDPHVRDAIEVLLNQARWEGYQGAYKEMQTGERFDLDASPNHE